MKTIRRTVLLLGCLLHLSWMWASAPGVTICYHPASKGMYVGSPSICIMSNGDYIATHDLFANSQTEYNTEVYKSEDRGLTWERQSVVKGQFWSSVFCISDTLYLIGTDREYGNLVVRRSTDGKSWTTPSDSHHGLLAEGEYHSAPSPVVVHQ